MAARDSAPELNPSSSLIRAKAAKFCAVVFRQLPDGADFSRSETIVLPGQHSAGGAWEAVYTALRHDGALVGGTIREV